VLDLHNHTTASDGKLSPTALVERAHRRGITHLAVTDHDTVAGLPEAQEAGARLGVEVVVGIELSCAGPKRKSLHILGYIFDPSRPEITEPIASTIRARDLRNTEILERLAERGLELTIEEVQTHAHGVVGRPHFARALLERGYVPTIERAFERWLGDGKAAHVVRDDALDPADAIRAIHSAGGVAVLAHPLTYETDPGRLEKMFARLVAIGLDGVELHYPDYSPGHLRILKCLIQRFGLIPTGGSDFHSEPGPAKQPPVPPDTLDRLHARAARYR